MKLKPDIEYLFNTVIVKCLNDWIQLLEFACYIGRKDLLDKALAHLCEVQEGFNTCILFYSGQVFFLNSQKPTLDRRSAVYSALAIMNVLGLINRWF